MNTRQKYNYHLPSSNLSLYQKGVYFTGIKVFNNLPQSIKNLSKDTKQFKSALKNYLHAHSFYSIDEYFTPSSVEVKNEQKLYLLSPQAPPWHVVLCIVA
jgi:hypothetical protein